jgi:hypothetical protein
MAAFSVADEWLIGRHAGVALHADGGSQAAPIHIHPRYTQPWEFRVTKSVPLDLPKAYRIYAKKETSQNEATSESCA